MQYSPREAQFFPYEAKGTLKIMEYLLLAKVGLKLTCVYIHIEIKSILSILNIGGLSRPNPHATFHLIGWKQNMKAVRSK